MAKDTKEVVQHEKRKAHDTRSANNAEGEPAAKKKCLHPDSSSSPGSSGINGIGDQPKKDAESVPAKVYDEYYLARKAQQKAAMERPKLFLTQNNVQLSNESETSPSDKGKAPHLPRLSVIELQTLLIFALQRGQFCNVPGWCCLKRSGKMSSLVLVVLGDVSATDFKQNQDCFPFLCETFKENLRVRLVSPSSYFSSLDVDLYAVPLTKQQLQEVVRKNNGQISQRHGKKVVFPVQANFPLPANIEGYTKYEWSSDQDKKSNQNADAGQKNKSNQNADAGMVNSKEISGVIKSEKDADPGVVNDEDGAETKVISPVQLLLSTSQMVEEKYPMPGDEDAASRYPGFINTKMQYEPATKESPLFALDCEMCLTTVMKQELTRVSIVNEKGEVVYDELVKPYNGIINYLTRYSGITKKMLDPVTKRLEYVQREIAHLLPPDAILCGQSLCNDLNALKIFHPYVIDTSVIYNLSGNRRVKCGLKRLSWHFLGKVIQDSSAGHCSSEDAIATIDLVKFKLSKGLEFGDAVLGGITMPNMESFSESNQSLNNPQTEVTRNPLSSTTRSKNQQTLPGAAKVGVMMCSLFDFLDCRNIEACMIGREKLVTKYQEEPGLKCLATSSDRQARKEARKAAKDTRFTWAVFAEFADLLESQDVATETKEPSAEEKKVVFRNLDKNLKKLVKKLREKCLVAVVMPGRSSTKGEHTEAAAFFHIT
ncbi:uncharacterized protein [Littorina saxatilis]|uniref:Exonuclease domain-containing protein n=1 Tax=Littorina saxatilis TaxID=31220 RepID=A0AAN9BXV6_9CAEN